MTTLAHHHPYLAPHADGGFIAFAHRGGASDAPENTIASFRHAVSLGYRYLETDVQLTADGVLVAFHDNDLMRTCGRPVRISDLPWHDIATARVDGREPIPLLADVLEEFPGAMINIDAKADSTVGPLVDILRATASLDRVCIGSFSHGRLRRIRERLGSSACTAASPPEVLSWIAGRIPAGPSCFQVPIRQGPIPVVTARTVERAHASGRPVHVWTVDRADEMQRLIDLGVHGIMTDQCHVLRSVARANDLWAD